MGQLCPGQVQIGLDDLAEHRRSTGQAHDVHERQVMLSRPVAATLAGDDVVQPFLTCQ